MQTQQTKKTLAGVAADTHRAIAAGFRAPKPGPKGERQGSGGCGRGLGGARIERRKGWRVAQRRLLDYRARVSQFRAWRRVAFAGAVGAWPRAWPRSRHDRGPSGPWVRIRAHTCLHGRSRTALCRGRVSGSAWSNRFVMRNRHRAASHRRPSDQGQPGQPPRPAHLFTRRSL